MKPTPPDGFPRNFIESLFFDGPCAIPLGCKDGGGWKWYACIGGRFLLRNGQWGNDSGLDSFGSAFDVAKKFQDHKENHK